MSIGEFATQIEREHDACGIYAQLEKSGHSSRKPIKAGLQAIAAMQHRAGFIGEEGDGCGLQIDLPRALWKAWLSEAKIQEDIATNDRFYVGHILLERSSYPDMLLSVEKILAQQGLSVLLKRSDGINTNALGPKAHCENPVFLQLSGLCPDNSELALFKANAALEQLPAVHVASLSRHTVVYKTVGGSETLSNYYKDLQDDRCLTSYVLAHTRFSTNTSTSFARVQPFGILGHNGEINTITRFYSEACMLNVPMSTEFSDSQMVDWGLHSFMAIHGWSLFESVELLFPAILNEMKQLPQKLMKMYSWFRSLWGPFAQGPAALIMRYAEEAVFSVDALGLRPLWLVDTEEAYCFSSEPGIIPPTYWTSDPKPLAPGEKIGAKRVKVNDDDHAGWKLYSYSDLQSEVLERATQRFVIHEGDLDHEHSEKANPLQTITSENYADSKPLAVRAAAFGFRSYDFELLETQMCSGTEPIQSLGFDQPITALSPEMSLLSDYLQETVAVVTNPAIDREREIEHFSTRVVLGCRPSFTGQFGESPRLNVLTPLLLDEIPAMPSLSHDILNDIAERQGTMRLDNVVARLQRNNNAPHRILLHRKTEETSADALKRFQDEAQKAAQAGAHVIILDDRTQFIKGEHTDPFAALAAVHRVLSQTFTKTAGGESLRRRLSLILCSGGIRNLHDIAVALGLGADAVTPYLMWEIAAVKGGDKGLENLLTTLTKGLEKVISTLGIHEIRGYERLFGAIGLSSEVADVIGVPAFCGNEKTGYSFAGMDDQSTKRAALYLADDEKKLRLVKARSYFPSICKSAANFAKGQISYGQYLKALEFMENKNPISLRHALRIKENTSVPILDPQEQIDSTIDGHAYPFVISSMSFGSQGETAFRAYAEAAYRLNIVSLNGEGGEIKDLLQKYSRNRGREIASGRFGVNAEICNHAYVLELKIGQGAKPGEGGHLPGSKVTEQVAAARNALPGVDLISPSNNHDIYSIEDLAQVIYEFKQVNPKAKIAVKVPVVPNIGTISVGIVKAGADIVELSGFDGGTGAARSHAIRHVGLPMEIGIKLVHDALCNAGMRESAEIWADGGMKSGTDVMKSILLGANRVGFATMAIAAIGCTDCRMCMKREICSMFNEPHEEGESCCASGKTVKCLHDPSGSVNNLERFFKEIGRHIQELTAQLGAKRTQDLVGRRDLLEQINAHDTLDLQWLLEIKEAHLGKGARVKNRTNIQEVATATTVRSAGLSNGTDSISVIDEDDSGYSEVPLLQAVPRALGVHESGRCVRERGKKGHQANVWIEHSAVAGAGFAAYQSEGMTSIANGGSQDGTGKTALGGKVVVLKTANKEGNMVGGSVGKGLAYGAQGGLFIIQGNADARAGIRLSGADLVIGGELQGRIHDELAFLGARANIKGFAFEYMTAGRAVVLGDPGPWMCSGMTGGRVYLRIIPAAGLTEAALRKRLAKGAQVELLPLDEKGYDDVSELLRAYRQQLSNSGQLQTAKALGTLINEPQSHFLMVVPQACITDQEYATE
jgi:glutamate synthase (NADPH) large chain